MKFLNREAAQLYLIELGQTTGLEQITENFVPTDEMQERFFKSRRKSISKLKSFRRSQASKEAWRHSRYKYMKGIKGFHKSTEGKRFHRSLGRFLATRETFKSIYARESASPVVPNEQSETLKALSSLKTHLFIELDYYHPMNEEIDLHILIEDVIPVVSRVEESLVKGELIQSDDLDLLMSLVDVLAVVDGFSKEYGLDEGRVAEAIDNYNKHSDPELSGYYLSMLKALHEEFAS